ncbi:hypothetical protein D9M73_191780 [compost metagenome]
MRFDPGFARHLIGGVQQVGYLVDVRGDEACQYALGIAFGQLDGRMQVRQLQFQLSGQLAGLGLVLMGFLYLLAQCGGVHEVSRINAITDGRHKVACF